MAILSHNKLKRLKVAKNKDKKGEQIKILYIIDHIYHAKKCGKKFQTHKLISQLFFEWYLPFDMNLESLSWLKMTQRIFLKLINGENTMYKGLSGQGYPCLSQSL